SYRGLFAMSELKALLQPDVWDEVGNAFDPAAYVSARADSQDSGRPRADFAWSTRAELRTYTLNQLLRDTDVMSMAHSLEVRVPLLDHCLVEAVLGLPGEAHGKSPFPKPLLATALRDLLPGTISERRDKQGFVFP